jgi:hypothetical protein
MFVFICFSAATATAENLQTIFITRFFAGVMASSPVATVGGGLADMFDQKERGTAVVFYSLAVVAGPTLGPIIGELRHTKTRMGMPLNTITLRRCRFSISPGVAMDRISGSHSDERGRGRRLLFLA